MVTPLLIAAIGWGITLLCVFLSPMVILFAPRILAAAFDPSQKLRDLQIRTIPELGTALQLVELQRMLKAAEYKRSDVTILDMLAGMLRNALYEAQDIIDLVDYHWIERSNKEKDWNERKVVGVSRGSRWLRRLCGALDTACCCDVSWSGIVHFIPRRSAQLLRRRTLCQFLSSTSVDHILPVTTTTSGEPVPVATGAPFSDEPVPVASDEPVPTAPSDAAIPRASGAVPSGEPAPLVSPLDSPAGRWLSRSCSFVDFISYWLVDACGSCKDWYRDVTGITSYQDNESNFVLPAISRWKLKKRIEKVESTIREVNNSPLYVASKEAAKNNAFRERSENRPAREQKVFRQEKLLYHISEMLESGDSWSRSTSRCYSVIGIYGVAGSGKSTFVRCIREHIKKKYYDNVFEAIMYIHVSKTFNLDDILHDMLEDITKDRHSNIAGSGELKNKLKQKLAGKRFLLILDDIWTKENNFQELKEILSAVNVGMKGSKVFLTSRDKQTVTALGSDELFEMPDWEEDAYFDMFMHYALPYIREGSEEWTQFAPIGEKIAKKLDRSPIAAVVVAGQLQGQSLYFWGTTAELQYLDKTSGALCWSYLQLKVDIRRCFQYCNIFPRRFKLKRDELVRLWIAQGLVKTGDTTEDIELVAEGYVEELVSFSFLQSEGTSADTNYFTIHDLLREIIDNFCGNDFFRIENARSHTGAGSLLRNETREGWKDVRHLFLQNYDEKWISDIVELKNLRTLVVYAVGQHVRVEDAVIKSIFKKLQKLRVLILALSQEDDELIKEPSELSVAKYISRLKHLRYFAFRASIGCSTTLPSSVTELYHMQVLDFGSSKLEFPEIGRLILLRHIRDFTVRKQQGYEVKQLRHLNRLRGTLRISSLENVKSKEEAIEANLAAKGRLTNLSLSWSVGDTRCTQAVEAQILEGFCPPMGLETLSIFHYEGSEYPDWMVGSYPMNIHNLSLEGWTQLGSGPELAFPHLRSLDLRHCSWRTLPSNTMNLTSLKKLLIFSCLNIQSLPVLPRSLQVIILINCNDEFMKSCQTDDGNENWENIKDVHEKIIEADPHTVQALGALGI